MPKHFTCLFSARCPTWTAGISRFSAHSTVAFRVLFCVEALYAFFPSRI